MIRLATQSDILEILPLAVKFLAESPMAAKTEIDEDGLSAFLDNFITSSNSEVWVIVKDGQKDEQVVGMSGVMVYPFYANPSYLIAQELFWYVAPNHRGNGGELLKTMEVWAKSQDAQSMHMISLETRTVDVMDKYYKRSGYTAIEHTYSKEL